MDVLDSYDVVVIGGGPAGVSAAISSARAGARTLLIERYGFLGGMATAGMVGSFCGFFTAGPLKKPIVGGVARTILDSLKHYHGVSEKRPGKAFRHLAVYQYNPDVLKFVMDKVVLDAGVNVLFHSLMCEPLLDGEGKISGILIENKSGRVGISGKIIVDTTGDGDVAARAGAPFETGDGKGSGQSMTTIFRLINVDFDKIKNLDYQALRLKLQDAVHSGEYKFSRVDGVIGPALPSGILQMNITGIPHLNGTTAWDLTKAEIEGRRQAFEYLRFFTEVEPGFERAEISALAPQVGVRESRRILGEYVLNEKEVLEGRKFQNGIGLGAWPVEFHDPQDGRIIWKFLEKEDDYYSIPIGCLIPKNSKNLLVAGRCASTTHISQASTRVIGQAFAMGEAAGTLAALSSDLSIPPSEVEIEKVRSQLGRHGAMLEA